MWLLWKIWVPQGDAKKVKIILLLILLPRISSYWNVDFFFHLWSFFKDTDIFKQSWYHIEHITLESAFPMNTA